MWLHWASSCKGKGGQVDSQSGHMPGLHVGSPRWGGHARGNWPVSLALMILFLSPSLPSSLESIKGKKKTYMRSSRKAKYILNLTSVPLFLCTRKNSRIQMKQFRSFWISMWGVSLLFLVTTKFCSSIFSSSCGARKFLLYQDAQRV